MTSNEFEKVIFILGGGHSGSTLTDMIIGASDAAFSVGELSYLDVYKGYRLRHGEDRHRSRLCTCGHLFNECPFWSKIELDSTGNIEMHDSFGKSLRILLNILSPLERWLKFRINGSENIKIYRQIFSEARKTKPGVRFIVDSSKDPRRLYELIHDPEIGKDRLAVIHLVRDGRGYVYSYQQPKRLTEGLKLRNTVICVLEWIGINTASRLMIRKYGLNAHLLSYDEFADRPAETLDKLGGFLDVDLDGSSAVRRVEQTTFHNVHGNPMRRKEIGTIKRRTPWTTEFPIAKRVILSLILYPFNRLWVYSRR